MNDEQKHSIDKFIKEKGCIRFLKLGSICFDCFTCYFRGNDYSTYCKLEDYTIPSKDVAIIIYKESKKKKLDYILEQIK